MTDNTNLPDQPGVWSQELPAGHIALKGDTDGSKRIPEQIHMMKAGESPPVPEYVSPVPPADTQSRLTPSERRARLESIAIPEIERLTKAYRDYCDQLEAFEHDRPAREHQLATDYVYRDKQHSKIRMHHIPGKSYLNFALQNGVFTVPPPGREGVTYKPLDINMSNHGVSIHVLCVPENVQSLSELASDAETKKYVSAELKRRKKRLEVLRDNSLSELDGYKQMVREQLATIPTIEAWLA
ncbi:TPA: hypothetical protein ACR8QZ_004804 [Enterobacter roggenkampii]